MESIKDNKLFNGLIDQKDICFDYIKVDKLKFKKRKDYKLIILASNPDKYTDLDKAVLIKNLNLNFKTYKKLFIYMSSVIKLMVMIKPDAISYKDNKNEDRIEVFDNDTLLPIFYNKDDTYYVNAYSIIYDYKE